MQSPLVSIVLCTYNGDLFLEEQLQSIFHQDHKNIELIISDDASTDGTRAILEKYRGKEGVSIFCQEKNIGLSANFNFAISKTSGEYVAFADQDDIWLPQKISSLLAMAKDHLLVYSNSLLVDEKGQSLEKYTSGIRNMYTGNDTRGLVFYSIVWGHGMMVQRSLLDRSLPIPEKIHHDDWLAFKAMTLGGIFYLDKVLTLYRQHQGSTTKNIPVRQAARSREKRAGDYLKRLYWIGLMRDHERPDKQNFYQELYQAYSMKGRGRFSMKLLGFMLAHHRHLFRFSPKSFLSQLVEIIKQCRGEKTVEMR